MKSLYIIHNTLLLYCRLVLTNSLFWTNTVAVQKQKLCYWILSVPSFRQQKWFTVSPMEKHLASEEKCQQILPVVKDQCCHYLLGKKGGQKHPHSILSPVSEDGSVYTDVDWHTKCSAIASEGWMYFPCLLFFKPKNQKENAYDQKYPEDRREKISWTLHAFIYTVEYSRQ